MTTKKPAKKTTASISAPSAKVAKKITAKKAVKKAAATKVGKKAAPKKVVTPAPVVQVAAKPTPDAIARAAYLNYRKRVEQGLPGDSHGDWVAAERHFKRTSES